MQALRLQTKVTKGGRVNLPRLPLRQGEEVEVIILHSSLRVDPLLQAAESSLAFWDNPTDDEVWNDA